MILTDIHNHSTFSADGISPLEEMVFAAKEKGMTYYGVSEHFDFDYLDQGILAQGKVVPMIDYPAYFAKARALQAEHNSERFHFLAGGEFGFCPLAHSQEKYQKIVEEYSPDFIVNSVHTLDKYDCYFHEAFVGKTKEYMYSAYLERIRLSLDAPYRYDIIPHLGYVSRNAPYEDKKFRYEDFSAQIDDILRTIISKGKILEVNSSSRGAGSDFLPDVDVLTRYFELGGRLVSYASDAHNTERIGEKRETVVAALKRVGFTHLTVPNKGEYLQIQL